MRAVTSATRHLVLRLLNDGFSQQEVKARTGLSLSTISRINQNQVKPRKIQPLSDTPPGYDPRKIRRCPGCGSKVYLWPCLACQLQGVVAYPPDLLPQPAEKIARKRTTEIKRRLAA